MANPANKSFRGGVHPGRYGPYFEKVRTMISAVVLALVTGSQSWSAQWEWHHSFQLAVIHRGMKHVISEGTGDRVSPKVRHVWDQGKVQFKDRVYVGKGGQIVDLKSGKAVDVPHLPAPPGEGLYAPVFRTKGGIALRDRMFWIFSWDNVEAPLEPPFQAFAYEVVLKSGAPSVVRSTELPSLIGAYWFGYEAAVTNSSLAIVAGSRFVDFDLTGFRVRSAMRENVVFAPSGAIFRSDGHRLQKWSFETRDWKLIREASLGFLYLAASLGKDDLLYFHEGLMLASNGRTFKFPRMSGRDEPTQVVLYLDSKIGVGFRASNQLERGAKEWFLSTNLKPLCPIAPVNER